MKDADINQKLVVAGPDPPDTGVSPDCSAQVEKRKRTCMDRSITCFYRHNRGQEKQCPRRYRLTQGPVILGASRPGVGVAREPESQTRSGICRRDSPCPRERSTQKHLNEQIKKMY
jgi:hypothetical protein